MAWLYWCLSIILVFNSILHPTIAKASIACEDLPKEIIEDISKYASTVDRIIEYYRNGPFKGETWKRIADFVDKFGSRITGSKALEDAIDHLLAASNAYDLDNVHGEEIDVTAWVRGEESATLLKPRNKNLPILGLGYSIGTTSEGITAEAIVVKSFDELRSLPDSKVKGKIVVYDQPFTSYGETNQYRGKGASEASKKGAVAALIRSISPFSMVTPHTGIQFYENNIVKIPVAALTHEDADYLYREQQRNNPIEINFKMGAKSHPAVSRNFVSELSGSIEKDRIVIVSGHIDSWDVGDGAMDDAGGSFISWLAPIVIKELGLKPRRTIRTVLFTAEEEGVEGAAKYEQQHKHELNNLSFVMESDYGTFAPLGIMYQGSKQGECMVKEILKMFASINATDISLQGPGPDIAVWTSQGVPGGGLLNDNKEYFWYHHTDADTMNVLNSDVMDLNGAFWTAFTYIIADMKYEIPRDN